MSNVDVDNGIAENPHPEADAGANFLDEGAEGQDRELQDGSGDDSVEEGTEAELEAEDEAGTHQDDRGLEVNRGDDLDVADTDSEAEDHVIQEAGGGRTDGGAGLEESEKSLTEDDSLGACGGSMVEADIVTERSLVEADINGDVDNDHTEADIVESPGSDRTDIVAAGGPNSQAVSDLTEADVGVIASVDGLQTEKCSEVVSVKAKCQSSDLSESDGNLKDLGADGDKQTDTAEADHAMLQAIQSSYSAITGNSAMSTACSGTPQSNTGQEHETKVINRTETVTIVCDLEKDKLESSSRGASVRVLNNSENSGVLEDEIGIVHSQGGDSLLVRPGLQHAESEESYEPECDQDSDEVRMSPHHNSQHVQDSDEVRMSPQCASQNQNSEEISKSDSTDSVYDSDVLLLAPNNGVEQGCVQEAEHYDLVEELPQNNSQQARQGIVVQDSHTPQHAQVLLDSGDSSLDTQSVNPQCSNVDIRNGSNKKSSPKTQTSSASAMAATISSSFLDSSSGNSNASSRQSSPARLQALPKSLPGQNCDIQTMGARSKCRELDLEDDDLLDELESELTDKPGGVENRGVGEGRVSMARVVATECLMNINNPNGMVNMSERLDAKVREQISHLQQQLQTSKRQLQQKEAENEMIRQESEEHQHHAEAVIKERDSYLHQLQQLKTKNPTDDLYLPQIKELEFTIAQQQGEIKNLKDKLTSHDTAAKRAITTLQSEMKLRVDQVTKMYEDANREKDSMVVKYAESERNFLEVQKMKERLESKLREAAKEREGFNNRAKDFRAERKRLATEMESRISEAQALAKDLEKAKEALSSQEVRIKWAQNKLKAELEAHKDTKVVLEKTNMKLKEAKEETEQIRKDCQAIVKTYQESEEIKSNSLDHELKKKKSELLLQQQEKTDQEELHQATRQELDHLKKKHKDTLSDLQVLKDNMLSLETKHQESEQLGSRLKEMIQKQKQNNKELLDRVEKLTSVEGDFRRAQSTIKSLDAEISELKISNKDLLIDMDACRKRETEKLELTEKLSAKNAELQSENTILHNRGMTMSSDVERQRIELHSLEGRVKELTESLTREQAVRQQEVGELTTKLAEKSQAVEELSRMVEDEKDEIKTLKRKHVNNIKDLTRQLQQTRRRLETFESNGERDTTSMGSRTSSNGSLNTACNTDSVNNSSVPPSVNNHVPSRHSSPPQEQPEYPVITEQVEPDRQLLIERIVKLQRSHARKNEKIEFMADHISQLVDQIQKKNKIIHSYALREESGTLTPELMDYNKAQFSKKHSIMASLYSSHQTDGTMTLDLSLEINRKLQAVLEDALLKNITLKESIDTLGEEISRLSQENRQLQLKSQAKKPTR